MTTLYWYKTGVDASWETLTGNWWLDAEHTQQASAYPVDGDSVYVLGSSPPTSVPPIALQELIINTDKEFRGSSVTIMPGGTLIANSIDTRPNIWAGDASQAAIIEFYACLINDGILGNNAKFYNKSVNRGTVGNNAEFYDLSSSVGSYLGVPSTLGKNAKFYDYSYVGAVTCGDGAQFNDYSYIAPGAILGTVTWNSDGYANLSGDVTLNGDWILLKPLNLSPNPSGSGRIIIPRRERYIAIGTGGAKIVIDQAYGYRCGE